MTRANQLEKVNVLSVLFDNVTLTEMRDRIKLFFESETDKNLFIVTANPEIVDFATENVLYRKLINSANYVIPDGTGVVMASKLLKKPLKERVPGIELMKACLKIANANYQKVILLGAKDEVVVKDVSQLSEKYQNINFHNHNSNFQ